MSDVGLVVVAAGTASRFGTPKQLASLADKPLIEHTLCAFDDVEQLCERVVVLNERVEQDEVWKEVQKKLSKSFQVAIGGRTRSDSVRNGVEKLTDECEFVLVHDGARPFPPLSATRQCLDFLVRHEEYGGVILATLVSDTLKALAADGQTIEKTVDRAQTARAETPQLFRKSVLQKAFEHEDASKCTDEAQLLEISNQRVAIILHEDYNPKITRPMDLFVAEAWLQARETEAGKP